MLGVRTVAVSNISFSGEFQDMDQHIKSLMVLEQNMTPDGKKSVERKAIGLKYGTILKPIMLKVSRSPANSVKRCSGKKTAHAIQFVLNIC